MFKAILILALVVCVVKPTKDITVHFFAGPECRDQHSTTSFKEGECILTTFKDFSWYSTYTTNATHVAKNDWEGPHCIDHIIDSNAWELNTCL